MNKQIIFFSLAPVILLLFSFSCKTAKLSDAIAKEEKGEYYDAARIYRKVYAKTSAKKTDLRGNIAFRMAECYRKIEGTQRSLTGYNNAIRYEYDDSSKVFYSALMMHKLGRYAEAKKQYAVFLDSFPDFFLAKNGIIGCDSAVEWKKNPTRYIVKKQDNFNSRYGEFSPVLSGDKYDQLIFTSSRKDATGNSQNGITGAKYNDFYVAAQDEKGLWKKPEHIESALNTEFDEGVCSLSADGATMYYTFCGEEEGIPKTADIYKSSRSGAQWNAGERVAIFKDTLSMAAHPAVGADGYLYFVSDVKGGYGGKDIWRVLLNEAGTSAPENPGPDINTPGDEMFPYMRNDSTLYFSSNGHPGMGGLDIFKAVGKKDGGWTVENMKSPVNSMSDDFGICFEGANEKGFFSSNRNDARGADHIYSFELPGVYVKVEGLVLGRDEELIDGATVRMVGKDGSDRRLPVKKDGTYTADVAPGMDYVMMGSAPGYLNRKQTLSVPDEEKNQTFYVDFYLSSISKPVLVENIFYDFDKATIRPESEKALIELILLLQDNPNITIELAAHTDRKGTDEYNNDLSLRRAQSVVDYLIAGGIEKERLTPAGYGKTAPKTVTKNLAKEYEFLPENQILDAAFIETLHPDRQEIADQINRRTEFKVLRTNYRLF
jgi:peptidoglycan-associated lipoprotein